MLKLMTAITSVAIQIVGLIMVIIFLFGFLYAILRPDGFGYIEDLGSGYAMFGGVIVMAASLFGLITLGAIAVLFRQGQQVQETNRHLDQISAQLDNSNRYLASLIDNTKGQLASLRLLTETQVPSVEPMGESEGESSQHEDDTEAGDQAP